MIENLKKTEGNPKLERVDLTRYGELKERWLSERGALLPSYGELQREGLKLSKLWILLEDYAVEYRYKDMVFTREFKAGFMYDKGSVPKALQGLLSINDPIAIIAFLCHDSDYIAQNVSWKLANKLMFETMVYFINERAEFIYLGAYKGYLSDDKWWQNKWTEEKRTRRAKKYAMRKKDRYIRQNTEKARLYRFGVDTRKGERVYNASEGSRAWQNRFMDFKWEAI